MEREILTVDDIVQMFDVSKNKAYDFINSIKSASDTLGIPGKVHKQDYEYWLKMRLGKPAEKIKKIKIKD
ncbi:MAG TPA: hypothetical protein VIL23_05190 [Clostridia bacterium]